MKKRTGIIIVCLLITLAGCPGVEPGPGTNVGFSGKFAITEAGFEMEGKIAETPGTAGFHEFRNVSVQLYTKNGTLIRSFQIGTLNWSTNVSITSKQVPYYVIITSPEFWEVDNIGVDYYERTEDDLYIQRIASSKSELPVQ